MPLILDRRSLLFGVIAAGISPSRLAAKAGPPHILFVCQFGTVKSPIARELLKRRAAERGIALFAAARGITPQQHITPKLLQRLSKDRVNPAAEPLRRLNPKDVAAADLVIAFDRLPPTYRPRRFADWSDLPSMVDDYDHAREVLDGRIESLLDSLGR